MKVTITSRNFNASEHLKDTIEKKIQKLSKYFSDDIVVNIMLSSEKGNDKVEAQLMPRVQSSEQRKLQVPPMMQLIESSKNFQLKCQGIRQNCNVNIRSIRSLCLLNYRILNRLMILR